MIEDQLIDLIEPALKEMGASLEEGEEYREPALDILRYYRRPVRVSWIPFLGQAHGVVAILRQPVDVDGSRAGYERLLRRLAGAANSRFIPSKGATIGLTAIVLTPEPIRAEDEGWLRQAITIPLRKMRVVTFGVLRVNLGQEAMAMAVHASPDELFGESLKLADLLAGHLRQFVPLIQD
jgi:hypothetical protein